MQSSTCNAKSPTIHNRGRSTRSKLRRLWLPGAFKISGLFALLWFLLRVIPKPSRATYPCQRVAFPLASTFAVWAVGVMSSVAAFRKAKYFLIRSHFGLAALLVPLIVGGAFVSSNLIAEYAVSADNPIPNDPIGTARGVHPGRVVWIHDPDATDWDGSTGYWWDDDYTNQTVVDDMMSRAIRSRPPPRRARPRALA